jgi:hypothetical protein
MGKFFTAASIPVYDFHAGEYLIFDGDNNSYDAFSANANDLALHIADGLEIDAEDPRVKIISDYIIGYVEGIEEE